jgi:hypothetical protein
MGPEREPVPVHVEVAERAVSVQYGDSHWVVEFAHDVLGVQAGDVVATAAGEILKIDWEKGEAKVYIEDFAYAVREYMRLHAILGAGDVASAKEILKGVPIVDDEPVQEHGPLNVRAFVARREEGVRLQGIAVSSGDKVNLFSGWCNFTCRKQEGRWRIVWARMLSY